MASKVNIWNMALLNVGAKTITADTDDVKGVRVINQFYETAREATLKSFAWSFAIKQSEVAQTDDPLFGDYESAYTLPSDLISLIKLSQVGAYRIVKGRTLETVWDAVVEGTALEIEYVYRNEEESEYPPAFVTALAYKLAALIAMAMTSSRALVDDNERLFLQAISEAFTLDWEQDKETDKTWDPSSDDWLTARA